jgi:hypothetical protein
VPLGGTGNTARRAQLVVAVAFAAVLVAGVLFHARSGGGYPAEVAAMCRETEKSLNSFDGGYFKAVVFLSDKRARGLVALHPDAEHQALQADMLAAEAQLREGALQAQQRAESSGTLYVRRDFSELRALEAAQERRFQSLDIVGCAD